ncbi:MAG: DUF4402 domain-containing protein [Sediminibacterium sp.]
MKKVNKFLLAALLTTITIGSVNAQSTANATATANILTAISISKTLDMNFGNVSVQAATGGTVILSPLGIRSTTGGVTLPATSGTVTAAAFVVTGEGSYVYTITLPVTPHTISDGANTMTVTAFLSAPSGTGTLTAGTQTFTVGGTLNVAAAQVKGTYTSEAGFAVTVNYN